MFQMLVCFLVLEILVLKKKSVITPHKFSLDDIQKKLIENAGLTVGRNTLITEMP